MGLASNADGLDREDTFQTGRPRALLSELNTIKVRFSWGHQEAIPGCAELFNNPSETAPIHEAEAKCIQGLSGSAWLSQNNTVSDFNYSFCDFHSEDGVKSTTFVFRYASRGKRASDTINLKDHADKTSLADWLQAQASAKKNLLCYRGVSM